jgi:hypothetical protein
MASIVGRLLEAIWVVCDEDRIDYLVNFYSKRNRLSISIFTVIVCVSLFYVIDTGSIGSRARHHVTGWGYLSTLHH